MNASRCTRLLLAPILLSSCAFHTTATEWNDRVGAEGYPVFYTSTTKVGTNLLVAVPFVGRLGIDGMVNDMTSEITSRGGDRVRIVQGASENYWYGFPPFTWFVTPVVSTLSAEYRPSHEDMQAALEQLVRDEDDELSPERVTELAAERMAAWFERTGNEPQ